MILYGEKIMPIFKCCIDDTLRGKDNANNTVKFYSEN